MPIPKQDLIVSSDGTIIDETTGLFLPAHIVRDNAQGGMREIPAMLKSLLESKGYYDQSLYTGFYQGGLAMRRDENTLVVHVPMKGTDASELLLSALATGEIENVGVSPVPYPQLPGLLRRQQIQGQTIDISLTGRETPTRSARNAIARFNDSPLGVTQAVSEIVYNLRVYCRGCPIATLPITYNMDVWDQYGMSAVPIVAEGETEEKAKLFYMQADWAKIKSPVPYIADPLRFRQSGLPTWPYWFLADFGKEQRWVLLHQSHVIPVVPGNSLRHGSLVGTSSVWICLGFLLESILVIEERIEKKISAATNGLLGISGVSQTGDAIAKQISMQQEVRKLENKYFASDYTILASSSNKIGFTFLPLRQQDGVPPKERRELDEDILALAFNEPLTAVVSRGGIGFSTNAPENASQTSDTGVAAILEILEVALGTMFPRVQVAVSRQNDPAQRLNVATFKEFSSAIKDVNAAVAGEPVLSREEIRALIDRDLFELPDVEDDTVSAEATADSSDEIKETDSGESDDESNSSEVEATAMAIESYLLNVRYEFEPITPRGADDPIPEATPDPEAVELDTWDDDMPDYEGMLDAEPSDDEDFPERTQDAPEIESWMWLIPTLIFFNVFNGRSVNEAGAVGLRNDLVDIRMLEAAGLAPPLAVGDTTIQQWVGDLRDVTQRSFVHQYLLGRGGQNIMSADDWDILVSQINTAYSEIDFLAERLAAGAYSEGQIANYSATLLNSSVQGYEAGRASAHGLSLPIYPGDPSLICSGRCKCHWEHIAVFDGPRFIGYDSWWRLRTGAQHCASCISNSINFAPFVTRF